MLRFALAATRMVAPRVSKAAGIAPPCSALRSRLLPDSIPDAHSTGDAPTGLRPGLQSSERPPDSSPAQQRRLRKAERKVRRTEARHKARQLKAEATVQRMAVRQARLDVMGDEVRARLAHSPVASYRPTHALGLAPCLWPEF